MYKQIQDLRRKGLTRKEIVSQLEIDPKTVTKFSRMSEKQFKSYRKHHQFRDKVLFDYEKDILEIYKKNEFKRLNMSSVYDFLEERYGRVPSTEKTLRNYIDYLIRVDKLRLNENIRTYTQVPELPFGRQMQLDFGQYKYNSSYKLFILAAVLSASRYKYILFQDHPFKTREVIHHLLSCFDYFGGVPEELVIDQDKLMVVSENAGDIIYTEDFKYFIQEQEIKMYVCRPADPETKGKIENLIKYVKNNFLSIREFKSAAEANVSVLKWLKRRGNGKISQATQQIPALLIEHEREHLRPVRNSIFRKETLIGREERNVSDKARISVGACEYQLPLRYRRRAVEVYMTQAKLFVFDVYTGEQITEYTLSPIPGKLISKRAYRREKEKTAAELKTFVTGMYRGENWQLFTLRNFKTFSRYVRDQCLEAKKYFINKDIDPPLLDKALKYCLENNTLSFADLNDTYTYFKREHERKEPVILPLRLRYQGAHEPPRVQTRDLSVYKEILQAREKAHEVI
jgi:transposase